MDNLKATSLNGTSCASPRGSSGELSCDTAGWRVAVDVASKSTKPAHPAAAVPTTSSTSRLVPALSAAGQRAAPDPIEPASLPRGPLSAADYEKVGTRNSYLARKYDPDSWADRALDVFTGAMKDPDNVLTAGEQNEHRALSAKIVETVYPQPSAEAARLDAMATSPIGAIAWLATREAGGSPSAQDLALGLGRAVEDRLALEYAARAGLTFLGAQTEPSEAAIAAEAAKAAEAAEAAEAAKVAEAAEARRSADLAAGRDLAAAQGEVFKLLRETGKLWLDTYRRIEATKLKYTGDGWAEFDLYDLWTEATFCHVVVPVHSRDNPGPPSVYLNTKAAELGGGVVELEAPFSIAEASLKKIEETWTTEFGGKLPPEFGGKLQEFRAHLFKDNLTRFQVAFARIRAENPNFTARQIGALALAELPAAQAAARLGFDELTPHIDAYGDVYIDGRIQNVPTAVWGSARRTR